MSDIDNGGPAFPHDHPTILVPSDMPQEWKDKMRQIAGQVEGLSKREWFAGMAMQGMLANFYREGFPDNKAFHYAQSAFHIADAMLEESQKLTTPEGEQG